VQRDLKVKYRRSVLGYLWSVLNPLLMMIVLTLVFSHLFRITIQNFPAYLLTGQAVFNLFSEATTGSLTSIVSSSPLIKKVYLPKYIFPLEKCLFALVNTCFSLVAVLIILIVTGVNINWTILLFWIPILYVFVFATGVGLILASLNVFFRDMAHLYGVVIMAWMYLTPIIYPVDMLPPMMQRLMNFNPLHYYVDCFRQLVLYGNLPQMSTHVICISLAITSLVLGVVIFKKTQDKFILHI
jgi:ABC-2 type transport system permease protein